MLTLVTWPFGAPTVPEARVVFQKVASSPLWSNVRPLLVATERSVGASAEVPEKSPFAVSSVGAGPAERFGPIVTDAALAGAADTHASAALAAQTAASEAAIDC